MSSATTRLDAAIEAVRLASRITRRLQRELASTPKLTKSDRSPVTAADLAAQVIVAHTLTARLGKVTLVAEEDAEMVRAELLAGRRELAEFILAAVHHVWPEATLETLIEMLDLGAADPPRDSLHGFWTLDPIDGTKGFIRDAQYSICLAWIENGSPVQAALACPNLSKDQSRPLSEPDHVGTLYVAGAGEGLWEMSLGNASESPTRVLPLHAGEDEPIRLVESMEAGSGDGSEAEMVLERAGELAEPLHLDGQAKYAVVARGQGDVYLRLPRRSGWVERIWDHAAGSLIASEAGCAVTDVNGRSLDFSRGRGLEANRGVLVAAPALHGRVLAVLKGLGFGG